MRRLIQSVFLMIAFAVSVFAQTTVWEKSQTGGNYPSYLGTGGTERGIAYGQINDLAVQTKWERSQAGQNFPSYMGTGHTERGFAYGNNRIYLVSRLSGNNIVVINAANGDSVRALNNTGLSGGTLVINDAEVSDDGIIFVSNLTINASTSPFKVYKWANDSADAQVAVEFSGTAKRLGDKFTVTGSASDNSLTIWAAGGDTLVKFTTADNGATFTPQIIKLNRTLQGSPAVYPRTGTGEFFANSNGTLVTRFDASGNFIDSIPGTVVGTGSNAMRYFKVGDTEYLAVFDYITESIRVLDITGGLASAAVAGVSASLGSAPNGNGLGDVDLAVNGSNVTLYGFATNNGFAAYKFNPAAQGMVDRIYVVSRLGGMKVVVLNAATGDSVGALTTAGLSGGTFLANDAGVSEDGIIFAGNLTTNAETSPFKVYRWDNEASNPKLVINYTGAASQRFGDKITVTGSASDNSLAIWAAAASTNKVVKFTTADNGKTFTPQEITLNNGGILGSTPSVYPRTGTTEFFVNSNGTNLVRFAADGTKIDSIPGALLGTGSNAHRYFKLGDKEFTAVYDYITKTFRIFNITAGLEAANLETATASLGSTPDGNGTGDVEFKYNADQESVNIAGFASNNGIALYQFKPAVVVQVTAPEFSPAPGTFIDSVRVQITSTTPDALIYFTTDGSVPSDQSALYSEPVLITDTTTLKAIALKEGMSASDVTEGVYNIMHIAPPDTMQYLVWELTKDAGNLPSYFPPQDAYVRGMAYGNVNGKDNLYVVTRSGAHRIMIHDALTGIVTGSIPKPAEAEGVGYFHLNDVQVSEDGIIFVDNMSLSGDAAAPFRVYRWDSDTSLAKTVISYDGAGGRIGDMFSVYGKASDNTLTIWAAVQGTNKVIKFTTADNGNTFTPEVIGLTGVTVGSQGNIQQLPDGTFYLKSYAKPLYHISAAGVVLDSVPTHIVGTGATRIKHAVHLEEGVEVDYLMVYYPDVPGTGGAEYAAVVNVDAGAANAEVSFVTPSIGSTANGNGTGGLGYWNYDPVEDVSVFFVMGTNNGIAAYSTGLIEVGPEGVLSLTHTPGDLNVTIFNDGAIGADKAEFEGSGVTWKGQNGLFSGGLIFGTAARGQVNGLIPSWSDASTSFITDIVKEESHFSLGLLSNNRFNQLSTAVLNDDSAAVPYNVTVHQETYSNEGENFVYLRYGYTNNSDAALEDFYAGIFIDWDINASTYATNKGGIIVNSHLVYQYDASTPYYYGVAAVNGLSGGAVTNFYPDNEIEGRTEAFEMLSTIDAEPITLGKDYRTFQGSALGDIAPGETKYVTFAVVAGDDLAGIRANAIAAIEKAKEIGWTEIVLSAKEELAGIPKEYELAQNYPNPFNPSTTVKYGLPFESSVKIKIFNVLGELVHEMVNMVQQPGYHSVSFNAAGLSSGIYLYSVEAVSTDGAKEFREVKKMMLLK